MQGKKAVGFVLLSVLLFAGSLTLMLFLSDNESGALEDTAETEIQVQTPETDSAEPKESGEQAAKENPQEENINIQQSAADFEETLRQLREQNKRIVAIDPGCGGEDDGIRTVIEQAASKTTLREKELTLEIARKTRDLLEEEGIYVIMTREEDTDVSPDSRVYLANLIPADLFISLRAFEDADSSVYGMKTQFNEDFYMEGFDNEDLAYCILENVTLEANEKAIGVFGLEDRDSVLRLLMIPGVELDVGCMTNMQQARLLEREDYRDKIARGICKGITETFEKAEKGR